MLDGADGPAVELAMRLIVRMAEIGDATALMDVTRAHIDGCLYHGRAGLDFAERLVELGGLVRIPTTLNVATFDLLHPELYRGDPAVARAARAQMDAYTSLGCRPTWTCAPYQLPDPPGFGEHIAWAESNAIVYANSVLGARTNRYGDFIDICAAITGRVPEVGLHLDEARRGRVVFDLSTLPDEVRGRDLLMPVLGHLVGRRAGSRVAVVDGLDAVGEDGMKAFGAAAASSGAVALVHVVGVTPEAPTLEAALQGEVADETILVDAAALQTARDDLTTTSASRIGAVSLGTPHASGDELRAIRELLAGRTVSPELSMFISTGRDVAAADRDVVTDLESAGAVVVTDTCTYMTPILDPSIEVVMTDSAKWAFYAPGNIGVDVVFGSTPECVESAVAGTLIRDDGIWG
jgi:predicted aconitase